MNRFSQLRRMYLDFFVDPKRAHTEIPSAPLVPENDPTTLFTSSGMQPLVPYLLGQPHPQGRRLTDSQKSFRSQDIEEVGDNRHTTFFEMLGNWSLGDYFKKEQLGWFFSFLTTSEKDGGLGLDPHQLYVTVFSGNNDVPRDSESVAIWKELFASVGITAQDIENAEQTGMQPENNGRIFYYGEKKNWWSRSGVPSAMPAGEPGGPDSEMFFDFDPNNELHLHENSPFKDQPCHVNCDCGRFMEIGNSVFMQYQKQDDGSFKELPQKNVDFGGGLERLLAAHDGKQDVFTTDAFASIIQSVSEISHQSYDGENKRNFRIIADHLRAATMLAGDGVVPSNKQQGYVLRRLIRRAVRFGSLLGIQEPFVAHVAETVIILFEDQYPVVRSRSKEILDALATEEAKFLKTLSKGMKEIAKYPTLDGDNAFFLYETFGFPFELTEEIARERGQQVDYGAFRKAFEKHQDASRTASKGMFKGGLADQSETVTKYHTATHLLHAALRRVLGDHVKQQGSNITAERLRFDFSHPVALTDDEKQKVEQWMNDRIAEALPVHHEVISKTQALVDGAIAFFTEKYGDEVSVYTIGHDPKTDWCSKELCGGPHVANTKEIGPIKIVKEESIGSGKRRIYVKMV